MDTRARSSLLGALLLSACILPKSVGDGNEDGSTSSTGSPGSTSGDATGIDSATSLSPSTGTTGGPPSTTDETGFDTDAPVGSVCDPQPEDLHAWATRLVEADPPPAVETDADTDCEITSIVADGAGGLELELECDSGPLSFGLTTTDPGLALPLSVGETVHARMREIVTFDSGYYLFLSLSDPGGPLRLGYLHYPSRDNLPEQLDQWYLPLQLTTAEDVCELEPYDPPPAGTGDGGFIVPVCTYQHQRMAVDLTAGREPPVRIFDHGRGMVAGYDTWVAEAYLYHPHDRECAMTQPGRFLTVLMLAPPR